MVGAPRGPGLEPAVAAAGGPDRPWSSSLSALAIFLAVGQRLPARHPAPGRGHRGRGLVLGLSDRLLLPAHGGVEAGQPPRLRDPADVHLLPQPDDPGGHDLPAGALQQDGDGHPTTTRSGPRRPRLNSSRSWPWTTYVVRRLHRPGCLAGPGRTWRWSCSAAWPETSPRSSEPVGTVAVDVQDVSKRFRLYHEKYTSLKEKLIHAGRVPYEDLWALRDVSFDVQEGETVGILGRNGSGKSTLLKCICGVLQPTGGQVVVRGQAGRTAGAGSRVPTGPLGTGEHLPERVDARTVQAGGRPRVRRHRRLRRAGAVHRQPGQVLLVGHVRPARLRRGRQRRPRRPGGRRGAGGG